MVTTELIKELRELTDAPIQYCKKALELAEGDIELAKQELVKMGKATTRTVLPEQGAIGVSQNEQGWLGVAIGKCETDFVARNEKFLAVVDKAAEMSTDTKVSEDLDEFFAEATMGFKENSKLITYIILNQADTKLAYYLHHNRQRFASVCYTGDNASAAVKVATHIVATSPTFVSRDKMPQEEVQAITDALIEKARAEGKPEKSIEMIVKGQLKKKLAETVLYEQPFYADPKMTVEQYCKENSINIESFNNLMV